MGMTNKNALYVLAVAILMGTMTVVASADDQGMNSYRPVVDSISCQLEQGAEQPNAGEFRDPMGTGAIPDKPESSPGLFILLVPDKPESSPGVIILIMPDTDKGPAI
jgi:hypothetical protein